MPYMFFIYMKFYPYCFSFPMKVLANKKIKQVLLSYSKEDIFILLENR